MSAHAPVHSLHSLCLFLWLALWLGFNWIFQSLIQQLYFPNAHHSESIRLWNMFATCSQISFTLATHYLLLVYLPFFSRFMSTGRSLDFIEMSTYSLHAMLFHYYPPNIVDRLVNCVLKTCSQYFCTCVISKRSQRMSKNMFLPTVSVREVFHLKLIQVRRLFYRIRSGVIKLPKMTLTRSTQHPKLICHCKVSPHTRFLSCLSVCLWRRVCVSCATAFDWLRTFWLFSIFIDWWTSCDHIKKLEFNRAQHSIWPISFHRLRHV